MFDEYCSSSSFTLMEQKKIMKRFVRFLESAANIWKLPKLKRLTAVDFNRIIEKFMEKGDNTFLSQLREMKSFNSEKLLLDILHN